MNFEVDPVSGEAMQHIVEKVLGTPREIATRAKGVAGIAVAVVSRSAAGFRHIIQGVELDLLDPALHGHFVQGLLAEVEPGRVGRAP